MGKTVTLERKGHVLLIGLNRPEQRNVFNKDLIFDLAAALGELENNRDLRCGVLFANGKHFTLGLDLGEVGPIFTEEGELPFPEGSLHPWGMKEPFRTKPLVCAVHGLCLTLGIELALNSDIRLAAPDTRFIQMEVKRGISPFYGATSRFVHEAGWGNAMRYILTGDEFSSDEAYRMGIIQEIVEQDNLLPRAIELAERVANQSPVGTQTAIKTARFAMMENEKNANRELPAIVADMFKTEDAKEGIASYLERREASF